MRINHLKSSSLEELLFLASLRIRRQSTLSTPSLFSFSTTARKNTFTSDSLLVVVGRVQACGTFWASISAMKFFICSFQGYTWVPHFRFCSVYSCPLKMLQVGVRFSLIFCKFVYISVALPSKNLPIPPQKRVSPVKAHSVYSKTLIFLPSDVSIPFLANCSISWPGEVSRKWYTTWPLVWQGTLQTRTLDTPMVNYQSPWICWVTVLMEIASSAPEYTYSLSSLVFRILNRSSEPPAWSPCLCVQRMWPTCWSLKYLFRQSMMTSGLAGSTKSRGSFLPVCTMQEQLSWNRGTAKTRNDFLIIIQILCYSTNIQVRMLGQPNMGEFGRKCWFDKKIDKISEIKDHLKFLWQSPHWAALPEAGGFPVLRDLLHCLQRSVPQLLHLKEELDPQPDEYLHISICNLLQLVKIPTHKCNNGHPPTNIYYQFHLLTSHLKIVLLKWKKSLAFSSMINLFWKAWRLNRDLGVKFCIDFSISSDSFSLCSIGSNYGTFSLWSMEWQSYIFLKYQLIVAFLTIFSVGTSSQSYSCPFQDTTDYLPFLVFLQTIPELWMDQSTYYKESLSVYSLMWAEISLGLAWAKN